MPSRRTKDFFPAVVKAGEEEGTVEGVGVEVYSEDLVEFLGVEGAQVGEAHPMVHLSPLMEPQPINQAMVLRINQVMVLQISPVMAVKA